MKAQQRAGLEELDLSWNHTPPSGIETVMLALAGATAQQAHNFVATVSETGAVSTARSGGGEMSEGVGDVNTVLTNLDLSWNRIGGSDGQRVCVGVNALALCLAHNTMLLRLDLRNTRLEDVDVDATLLAAALVANAPCLRQLRLEENRVGVSATLLRALIQCAPLLSFGVDPGPASANPNQMFASLLPIKALSENPSGHYKLNLKDTSSLELALWILHRAVKDGEDTCRNELLN